MIHVLHFLLDGSSGAFGVWGVNRILRVGERMKERHRPENHLHYELGVKPDAAGWVPLVIREPADSHDTAKCRYCRKHAWPEGPA